MLIQETKVWGTVLHLFTSQNAAVSLLHLNAGFRCSRHLHKMRVNQFTVVSGQVQIEEWQNDGRVKSITLDTGGTYYVAVDVVHRFRVLKSGTMIEVYWPADVDGAIVRQDDIVRFDEGGPDKF